MWLNVPTSRMRREHDNETVQPLALVVDHRAMREAPDLFESTTGTQILSDLAAALPGVVHRTDGNCGTVTSQLSLNHWLGRLAQELDGAPEARHLWISVRGDQVFNFDMFSSPGDERRREYLQQHQQAATNTTSGTPDTATPDTAIEQSLSWARGASSAELAAVLIQVSGSGAPHAARVPAVCPLFVVSPDCQRQRTQLKHMYDPVQFGAQRGGYTPTMLLRHRWMHLSGVLTATSSIVAVRLMRRRW